MTLTEAPGAVVMVVVLSVGEEDFANCYAKQAFPPDTIDFLRVIKECQDDLVSVID